MIRILAATVAGSMLAISSAFAAGAGAGMGVGVGAGGGGEKPPEKEKPAPPKKKEIPPLTEDQKAAVQKAIAALDSDEFAEREAASKRILETGLGALPVLEEALKGKIDDPERRNRLEKLAAGFREQLDDGEFSADVAAKLKRKVSFEFVDTPLSEAVAFLKSLVKAKIELDPNINADTAISLRVTDMEAGMALEWMAKLADARVVKAGNTVKIAPNR